MSMSSIISKSAFNLDCRMYDYRTLERTGSHDGWGAGLGWQGLKGHKGLEGLTDEDEEGVWGPAETDGFGKAENCS